MQVDALKLIYFSPTETSRTTAVAVARGMGVSRITEINLTLPQAGTKDFLPVTDSLAIIAMPVYAGRLPEVAVERLRRVNGNGTPAVLLVLYGNRAYEDALIELRDVATEVGFVPVAGGAFLGEHSFATMQYPIAANRPDVEDVSKAKAFGESVLAMMKAAQSLEDFGTLDVPGNVPYQDYRVLKNVAPGHSGRAVHRLRIVRLALSDQCHRIRRQQDGDRREQVHSLLRLHQALSDGGTRSERRTHREVARHAEQQIQRTPGAGNLPREITPYTIKAFLFSESSANCQRMQGVCRTSFLSRFFLGLPLTDCYKVLGCCIGCRIKIRLLYGSPECHRTFVGERR